MAIKKSELYALLWASCEYLRGGNDPSQYKDYVLPLLLEWETSCTMSTGSLIFTSVPAA